MNYLKFIFLLPLFFIAGCSFFANDEDKEIVSPLVKLEVQGVSLDVVWSLGVGDIGDEDLSSTFTPALANDKIYAVNAKGDVFSLDRATGNINWKKNIDNNTTGAIGAGYGLVIIADVNGGVNAVDASNGETIWRSQASSEILAAPVTNGDVVIVQSVDSRVQAFDVKTGSTRWVYSASQSVLSIRGNASPLIHGDTVYVAFDNGKAAAIESNTGLLQWEQRFLIPDGRSELERVIDVQADPLVIGSDVFIGAYQGAVVCLDGLTGQLKWQEKASVVHSMTFSDGNINFVESGDIVKAFRLINGREAWKSDIFSGRKLSSPAAIGDYVAVADIDGYLHLLSQSEGVYSGRYSIGGNGVRANLLSDGIYLYVLTNSGRLSALRLVK